MNIKRFLSILPAIISLCLSGMSPSYAEDIPGEERVAIDFGINTYSLGGFPRATIVTDIDADGDLDIVVANPGNKNILLLLNNGDTTFVTGDSYPVEGYPMAVISGDLDGDLDTDLAVLDSEGSVQVFRQEGKKRFSPSGSYKVPDYAFSISSSDLDSDKDLDLIVLSARVTTILLNDGKGRFDATLSYKGDVNPLNRLSVDLNLDSRNDMVIGDREGISVLLNNGDGTFSMGVSYPTGRMPVSIAAADMDSDLDPDLIVANYKDHTLSLLINKGEAAFEPPVNYPSEKGPGSLTLSDIDSDEDIDMIVTNGPAGSLSVHLNKTVRPLAITTASLPEGYISQFYEAKLETKGGVAPYKWSVISGTLPPSLHLDLITGELYSMSKDGHKGVPGSAADDEGEDGIDEEGGRAKEALHEGHKEMEGAEPLLSRDPVCYCLKAPVGLYRFTVQVEDSSPVTATATADLYIEVLPQPGTVSGTIRYSGEKNGTIRIGLWAPSQAALARLFTNPIYRRHVASPGEYKVYNVYPESYIIGAFLDINNDGFRQGDEPSGIFGSPEKPEPVFVDNGSEAEGVDIELN